MYHVWYTIIVLGDDGGSANCVREALTKLSADGLLEYERNKGFRVASITEDDVHETYEVRRLLEPYVARLVVNKVPTDPKLRRKLHELYYIQQLNTFKRSLPTLRLSLSANTRK